MAQRRNLFQIKLHFREVELNGLRALDWRRSHSMYDDTRVLIRTYNQTFGVSEEFARQHFCPDEVCPELTFAYSELKPEDVSVDKRHDWIVNINLSDERAREIFKASRTELEDVVDFKTSHPLGVDANPFYFT